MARTNTLINRINEVKTAGESYKNSNILKSRKLEIENFRIPFNEVCQKFITLETTYTAIKTICDFSMDFESLRTSLAQLIGKVNHDEYDKFHVNTLKKEIDKINNEIVRTWKVYIANRTSAIDGVLLSLDRLISDMPEKQTLSNKKMLFNGSSPGSTTAICAIEDYVNTAKALLSKLNLKDCVVEFIKLFTSQGLVTLNELNIEVFEWLKTNGFADKIMLEWK